MVQTGGRRKVALAVQRGASAVLLLATCAPAPWVPLEQMRDFAQSTPTEVSSASVVVSTIRLKTDERVDGSVVGNLEGVPSAKPLRSARNHALVIGMDAGTPVQQFTVMLDASGADLWLPSLRCDSCANSTREQKRFFNVSESNTFMPDIALTAFGPAPRTMRVVYGGGSVAGFVVNDTVSIGHTTLENTTFLLAEEGDLSARRNRGWDGVCGIGWGSPEHGGMPLYSRLKEAGRMMVLSLSPTDDTSQATYADRRKTSEYAGRRLAVGSLLTEPMNIEWTRALKPHEHQHHGGMWVAKGRVEMLGEMNTYSENALLAIETGTSFLLAPVEHYHHFMRIFLPHGAFDRLCGQDHEHGGIVVCRCEAINQVNTFVTLTFESFALGRHGPEHTFTFPSREELFEDISDGLCIPQIQPQTSETNYRSPSGVLGSTARHHPGAMEEQMEHHGPGPVIPPGGFPGGFPMGAFPPTAQTVNVPKGMNPLQAIMQSLMNMSHAKIMKEVVVETLGDGTRCETDITRAANGTILSSKTEAISEDGKEREAHGPMCSETKKLGKEINQPVTPGQQQLLQQRQQQLQQQQQQQHGLHIGPGNRRLEVENRAELWIVGDVFLKRYGAIFDFDQSRIGFTRSDASAKKGTEGASIEAFNPGADSLGVSAGSLGSPGPIQTYETDAPGSRAQAVDDMFSQPTSHGVPDPLDPVHLHVRDAARHLVRPTGPYEAPPDFATARHLIVGAFFAVAFAVVGFGFMKMREGEASREPVIMDLSQRQDNAEAGLVE